MKKLLLCGVVAVLFAAGCASNTSETTTTSKMQSCLMQEGMTALTNGTFAAQGLSATAEEMSNTCLKKLALQSAGLDTQTNQMATSILSTLTNSAW